MIVEVTLLAYSALLPMVNPPTTATLLLGLSKGRAPDFIRRQVNLTGVLLFVTLCCTLFIGSSILDVFGISIPGLRLAGGLIIGFIGFRMLFPPPLSTTANEVPDSIAFVPLTIPSLCDPGTMALVISGAAQIADLPADYDRSPIHIGMVLAFLLISLTSWLVLHLAGPVCRIMGKAGIDALTRVMGFLLVGMGMQFIINGFKELLQDPAFVALCTG